MKDPTPGFPAEPVPGRLGRGVCLPGSLSCLEAEAWLGATPALNLWKTYPASAWGPFFKLYSSYLGLWDWSEL